MNAGIVIQCRYDSARLPGKILKYIDKYNKKTCLEYLIERCGATKYNVIIATSDRTVDDPISDEVEKLKSKYKWLIGCYRGEYRNVAKRLYMASAKYDWDTIIRVTGDDVFVDPDLINSLAKEKDCDYAYYPNLIRGVDSDLIRVSALERLILEYPSANEHLDHFFRGGGYKVKGVETLGSFQKNISLSIDYPMDLKLCRIIFENLYNYNPVFNTFDILLFLTRNNGLLDLNRKPRVGVYLVYKDYPYFIKDSLLSLQAQTVQTEVVILDYGSTLENYGLLCSLADNFSVVRKELPSFLAAVEEAQTMIHGDYVLRLDADDVLRPRLIEFMVKYLDANPQYSAVRSGYFVNGSTVLAKNNNLSCQMLVRRKVLDFLRYYDGQSYRDGVTFEETCKKYGFKIGETNEILFHHRIHEGSLTHDKPDLAETDASIRSFVSNS